MEKQACKKTEEALAEIYRNAQLALQSISNILPAVEDETLKDILSRQHEDYEQFSARASILARDMGLELKDPNPMKKMMMWGSIKMSTMTDNSRSHIAEMMVQYDLSTLPFYPNQFLPPSFRRRIAAMACSYRRTLYQPHITFGRLFS